LQKGYFVRYASLERWAGLGVETDDGLRSQVAAHLFNLLLAIDDYYLPVETSRG
jgi:hypothetical protein